MKTNHFERTREVYHFMTKNIITADENDTVLNISKIMAKKNISCVLIKGSKGPKGIVTERDITKRLVAVDLDPNTTKAKEIMSRPVIPIDGNRDLVEALHMMRDNKVRRLVVTSKKEIQGLVTQTDVINALYEILVDKLREIRDVYNRTQKLFKDSVKALFQALDQKDHYTGAHSRAVAKLALATANEMKLEHKSAYDIYLAGLFHDIGKIHISDKVLNKKGPLQKDEFEEIKQHPIISEMILKPITEFRDVLSIIRHHHEWINGKGYPDGIKGAEIPMGARIICAADSYNAMRTNRPYRGAMKREDAIANIKEMSGKQFDPKVVQYFLKVLQKNPSY